MDFNKKTIKGFFSGDDKHFIIPVYQRAYSWEEKQLEMFFNDLLEQIESESNYFYGNILLETIKKDEIFDVIDGQQRLTTLSIFIRAMINILRTREIVNIDLDKKEKIYLKDDGNVKLRPVEYDRPFYNTIIVDNKETTATTPSQKRIKEAKLFFEKVLKEKDTKTIIKIFDKIEETELTTIELKGKKDAALMFELQNNRGKDLTNMEKLKSYFMYQLYIHSKSNEAETDIEYISDIFKSIYTIVNDIDKLDEDSILYYHNSAYINGYNYRTLEDVKKIFKEKNNKVEWIKNYVLELKNTFDNIKKFEKSKTIDVEKLKQIGLPAYAWAFIIRGYKYIDSEFDLSLLFQILEKVIFRAKLINSRANIQERLNEIMVKFKGDVEKLNEEIGNKLNEAGYWSDATMENFLNGWMYGNKILNYLLWEYERDIQGKGYKIQKLQLENEQIEHISPQKQQEGRLKKGYDKYDEEFEKEYLNCLGNLMLISGSHNASIGNKPFKHKLESYKENPLLNQQAEIGDFCTEEKWTKKEIQERHNKIVEFCIKRWSF